MDYGKVLKRAWQILWSYRTLWVFGIILALTTASGGGGGGGSGARFGGGDQGGSAITPPQEIERELEAFAENLSQLFESATPDRAMGWIITAAIVAGVLLLLWIVVSIIARYVSEVALIRMVDDYETTEERKSVRQGFRLGWSRRAWRLFLIGLVVVLPLLVAFGLLFALALAPLLLWTTGETSIGIFGTVATIGLFFLILFIAIVVGTVAKVLLDFAWRACALEDLGVRASIRRGFALIKANWKSVGLMWLIMFGIGLGFSLVMIPLVLLVLAIGGVSGGLVLLIVRGLAGLLFADPGAWIAGGVSGGLVFLGVMMVPLIFVGGLYQTYVSTTWTLTYREIVALEPAKAEPAAELPPAIEASAEEV